MSRSSARPVALLVLLALLSGFRAGAEDPPPPRYRHEASGIAFVQPEGSVVDPDRSKAEPFAVTFTVAAPRRIQTYVLFKELVGEQSLAGWAAHERERHKKGGYEAQVVEKEFTFKTGKAIQFTRTTPHGTIYLAGFASAKDGKVYAFHHLTDKNADPDRIGYGLYLSMFGSLEFPPAK